MTHVAPRDDAFSVTLDKSMEVREGAWDGQRSREELRRYAERADGTVDWKKASKGYTIFDLNPEGREPVQADGKLNVAYVEDGELVGIGNGIRNALSRLPQVKPSLPGAVSSEAENALRGLLDKLNAQTADTLARSLSLSIDVVRGLVKAASDDIIRQLEDGVDAMDADVSTMVFDHRHRQLVALLDMVEEWAVHNMIAHPLTTLLERHGFVREAEALHTLTIPDKTGILQDPEKFAAWLAEAIRKIESGSNMDRLDGECGRVDLPDDAWVCCGDPGLPIVDVPWDSETMGFGLNGQLGVDAAAPGFFLRNTQTAGYAALRLPFARLHDGKLQAVRAGIEQAARDLGTLDIPILPVSQREPARRAEQMIQDYLGWATDDAQGNAGANDRGDGAVWRMSRIDFVLDGAQRSILDRAIAVCDRLALKNDATEIKTIAAELKADGLDDYIQDGFLVIPVLAARTGTQTYSDGRSSWGEFRSDEEVEASLASYGLKPFTDDHPANMVTSHDYGMLVKGACGQDAVLLDQPAADGNRYVQLTILVGDAATIRKIRDGKVELSAGYTTVPVRKSGRDHTGAAYDYLQTQIRINHLALVDRGRAGPLARISVDGAAWEVQTPTADDQERDDMTNQDQLDPEMARAVLMLAMAYMMPESPEAAAAALEKLAAMTSLEAEELSGMLKHKMPEMEPEPDMEMVEMDDGIKAKMTPDDAAAYHARAKANLDGATTLKHDLAEATAALKVMERKVDRLQAAQDKVELDALYEEIRSVCPQMVDTWDEQRRSKRFELDAASMREKATIDLDPEAKIDLDEARGTDTFDSTLKGAYRAAVKSARRRKANADKVEADPAKSNVTDMMAEVKRRRRQNYGSK